MSTSEHNVPLYSILVDGAGLDDDVSRRLREIKVQSYLRLPDMCTIVVTYQASLDGKPQPIDDHPFEIGSALEVKLGAAEDVNTKSLFKGQIVTVEVSFGKGGVELHCRGLDKSHLLMRSRHARTFQQMSSSDIVQKILGEAGLGAQCDATDIVHDFMQQDNESDWDFIWRLAERVGFEFVVEDGTGHFRKPQADDPIELEWPTPLLSFAPRVTAIQQVKEVKLNAFDPKNKQPIAGSASSPNQIAQIGLSRDKILSAFPEATPSIATEPVKTQSEATRVAQALLDKLANGYISAEGTTYGNPGIKAGVAINVSGVGNKYGGTYRIAAATHVLRGGGTYMTHFANSPAHTLLGSVGGDRSSSVADFGSQLVLGLVDDNNDPDGMGRVRVHYPALPQDDGSPLQGAWARLACVSAGNARGLMMLPQVGDEVLVGFEHGDTTRPYVIGSLFNGVDTPGDDLLQNKDGSFAVLSDKKIVATSKDEMKLTSDGKLTVTGQDDIELTGQKKLTQTAQQDITLDSQTGNVSIKSDTGSITIEAIQQLTLKCGPSSVQISPSGVTVSGPMISLGS